MGVVYTRKDYKFGIQVDQDFDGGPNSANWRQLGIENIEINPVKDIILPDRAVGMRQRDDADFAVSVAQEQMVSIPAYDVVREDLALWMLCAMQQITEAARYADCKANCVAEAMMIYRAAYLKAHYRPQFDRVLRDDRTRT